MDMKRLMTGTIVGGILMYGLGWLIWGTLFNDFFAANAGSATGVGRESGILWATAVGNLALAALYTMAILKAGATSVADGAKVGAITGFLVWLGVDFIHYANTNIDNLTATLADPALELVRTAIVGAGIAMVLAKTASTSSTDY